MTGGRINRFNIVKQSRDYDQHGEYIKLWIPELQNVPVPYVHEPWKMTQFQQIEYNCHLGLDYPNPIIPPMAYNASGQPGNGRSNHDGHGRSQHRGNQNNSNNNNHHREKQRKPNSSNRNRHQKYEMTGLKEGKYQYEDE
jgi:deoxyribodipyrimidine photo-lyase